MKLSKMINNRNKAVFLDRDGVLCEDTDYVTSFEKMHIFPFAREAIRLIHKKGYLAIVITNQSAVARGMMTEPELLKINKYLQAETDVDAVYYCPHLPPENIEKPPYRIFCNCRKPGIGLLQKAAIDNNIVLNKSYMVGDRISDIEAGKKAGTKTVYISCRKEDKERADFVYPTVLMFARMLI